MKPIAIFWHAVFRKDKDQPFPMAVPILFEQWSQIKSAGLADAAAQIIIGINGDESDIPSAESVFPSKSHFVFHGLGSKAENLTIIEIEKWAKNNPGWIVLYGHGKGASHWPGTHYGENVAGPWRRGMMAQIVGRWKEAVSALENDYDVAGCHLMTGLLDGTQNIFPGNLWWSTSDFLATVPSMYLRERIKQDGISALTSRFEAEVWLMNGRVPRVKDLQPFSGNGIP